MSGAAATASPPYDLCAVVTQPPKNVSKKGKLLLAKTPIQELAEELGVDTILAPASARNEDFLAELEALAPDLCVTAAYGQYLPKRFLQAPRLGTLNLHPSLLPRWRGASPVQRSLVAGDGETGITILYTVAKMDAGPIALQRSIPLFGNETAAGLLDSLFAWGAELLVSEVMPRVFGGDLTIETAEPQDEALVTLAPLIAKSEGQLWPHNETALQMRDKVRGFVGWPGTTLPIACSSSLAPLRGFRAKVTDAEVLPASELPPAPEGEQRPVEELIFVPAEGDRPAAVAIRPAVDPDSALLLRMWQLPGKQATPALTFHKAYMTKQAARWTGPEEEAELAAQAQQPKRKKQRRK